MSEVELHIEELILHGFKEGDRYRIAEALTSELSRLFSLGPIPESLSEGLDVEGIDAGSFRTSVEPGPHNIGMGAARKIYGGLGK
jgi:hypothetical protein